MSDDPTSNIQTITRPSMNGHGDAPPSDGRGKRIANRTPWLDLPEPFDNLKIRVWLDYPQEVAELWTAVPDETPEQASQRILEACKCVILQHDGWLGANDEALPQPDTDEFWELIPTPLGRAIVQVFFEELQSGNSRASRRAKRRNFRRR